MHKAMVRLEAQDVCKERAPTIATLHPCCRVLPLIIWQVLVGSKPRKGKPVG